MSNIQIFEHHGERVLTTEQLAQAYECEQNRIIDNFNASKLYVL